MDLSPWWNGVRTLGLSLLVTKVVLVVIVLDPFAGDVFALPKVAAGRALDLVLLAVLVGLTLRYGRATWRWSPLFVPAIGFVLFEAVGTLFAVDRRLALFGAPDRLLGLMTWADLLVVFLAASVLVRSVREARVVLLSVLLSSIPVVAYFAVQVAGLDPITWTVKQPISTFGNPTYLGAFCAIVAAMAAAMVMPGISSDRWPARVAVGAIAIANVITIALLSERAAVAGAFAGVLVVPLALAARRRRAATFALGAVIVGVASVLAISTSFSALAARFQGLSLESEIERIHIWSVAADATLEHPLTGVGPDNLLAIYPGHRPAILVSVLGPLQLETSVHDLFLQAGLTSGIPGLVALLSLISFAAVAVVRLWRREPTIAVPLGAGGVAFLINAVFMPDGYALEVIFWTFAGMLAGLASTSRATKAVSARGVPSGAGAGRLTVTAALIGIAALLSPTVWPAIDASQQYSSATYLGATGRRPEALKAARSSVDLDAGRPEYWATLGEQQLASGDVRAALTSFQQSTVIAPYQSGYWRNIAMAWLTSNDTQRLPRAIEAGRRAVAAQPVDPYAHEILGRALIQNGQRDEAIAQAQRAIDLWPKTLDAYEVLAVAYAQQEDWVNAESAIRGGLRYDDTAKFYVLMAKLYLSTGRRQDALGQLNLALGREPSNTEALQLRQQILSP